jgi:DNA-binding NarL/FixJ family response regulator
MLFVTRCPKMAAVPDSPLTPAAPDPLRVAVVEDDVACRVALVEAVNAAPDMRLQWAIATRAEALAALAQTDAGPADVLLVDLGLPDGSGLEVIAAARQLWPNCVAMVSTIFGDEEHVLRAIQVGAMGYLLKDVPAPQVVEEIRLLAAGGSPISPMVARKLLVMRLNADSATPAAPPEDRGDMHADTGLSTREIEVLRLVARGHTLEEVARALSLSRHTVRTFVRRLYAKLQVSTRAQAVREALRQGLL